MRKRCEFGCEKVFVLIAKKNERGERERKELLRLRLKGLCHTESTESTERFACGETV